MIYVALLLLPFAAGQSPVSEKSWEQLTNEYKDAEKIRREALSLVTEKHTESEIMATYMATFADFSRMLDKTRMAIEDVRSILMTDDLEKPTDLVNPWVSLVRVELLTNATKILETRLTQGAKDVPREALEDTDFWILLAAFQSSGEKLKALNMEMLLQHLSRPALRSRNGTDDPRDLARLFILRLVLHVLIANDSLKRVFTEAREKISSV